MGREVGVACWKWLFQRNHDVQRVAKVWRLRLDVYSSIPSPFFCAYAPQGIRQGVPFRCKSFNYPVGEWLHPFDVNLPVGFNREDLRATRPACYLSRLPEARVVANIILQFP